ncbi:MAG: hypothetical protein ACK5G7_02340 [Erysipelotrichaceae bacterium]
MKHQLKEYSIENKFLRVSILNYGATIKAIYYKNDNLEVNMVATLAKNEDYLSDINPYMNSIVGPTAGRIAYAHYLDNDNIIGLSANSNKHHLHGGFSTTSKKYFLVEEISASKLKLTLIANHEDDGYPQGAYRYQIIYTLQENTLKIDYQCIPPSRSLLNLTNHLYFNLGSSASDIRNHILTIPANARARITKDNYPDKMVEIPDNSPYNFRKGANIGEQLLKNSSEFKTTKGFDHPFYLDSNTIKLENFDTGYCLEIETDQEAVVVYTANWFSEQIILEGGILGKAQQFIALEVQEIPNSINMPELITSFYDAENPYFQTTSYKFTKINKK